MICLLLPFGVISDLFLAGDKPQSTIEYTLHVYFTRCTQHSGYKVLCVKLICCDFLAADISGLPVTCS